MSRLGPSVHARATATSDEAQICRSILRADVRAIMADGTRARRGRARAASPPAVLLVLLRPARVSPQHRGAWGRAALQVHSRRSHPPGAAVQRCAQQPTQL